MERTEVKNQDLKVNENSLNLQTPNQANLIDNLHTTYREKSNMLNEEKKLIQSQLITNTGYLEYMNREYQRMETEARLDNGRTYFSTSRGPIIRYFLPLLKESINKANESLAICENNINELDNEMIKAFQSIGKSFENQRELGENANLLESSIKESSDKIKKLEDSILEEKKLKKYNCNDGWFAKETPESFKIAANSLTKLFELYSQKREEQNNIKLLLETTIALKSVAIDSLDGKEDTKTLKKEVEELNKNLKRIEKELKTTDDTILEYGGKIQYYSIPDNVNDVFIDLSQRFGIKNFELGTTTVYEDKVREIMKERGIK